MDFKDYRDFSQRDYLFQMQQMRQMPFPLMYPYPDLYMSEMETDRDLQYLQQMYPADAKRMQKRVEEECDKLEYEGSMMYDEYPDRVSMLLICDRIADAIATEEAEREAVKEAEQIDAQMPEENEMGAMQVRRPDFGPGPERPPFDREPDRPPYGPGRPPHGPGRPPHGPGRPPHGPGRPPLDPGRRNLLEVLLYNEMYKRRCKHRRTQRFW